MHIETAFWERGGEGMFACGSPFQDVWTSMHLPNSAQNRPTCLSDTIETEAGREHRAEQLSYRVDS